MPISLVPASPLHRLPVLRKPLHFSADFSPPLKLVTDESEKSSRPPGDRFQRDATLALLAAQKPETTDTGALLALWKRAGQTDPGYFLSLSTALGRLNQQGDLIAQHAYGEIAEIVQPVLQHRVQLALNTTQGTVALCNTLACLRFFPQTIPPEQIQTLFARYGADPKIAECRSYFETLLSEMPNSGE